MTIKDVNELNIEEFAKDLAEQAKNLLPNDLTEYQKKYVIAKLHNYCILAGNALNHDENLDLTKDQVFVVVQLIGEWTFHKNIDLIRAKIPEKCWDPILQQVAFSVFEMGKKVITEIIEKDKALPIIEDAVKEAYNKSLTEFVKQGVIDEKDISRIEGFSNLDKIAEIESNKLPNRIKNIIKKVIRYLFKRILSLFWFFIVFVVIVCLILLILSFISWFITRGVPFITANITSILLTLLVIVTGLKGFSMLVKRDVNKQLKKLEQVKQQFQDLIDPNKMYCRLGTDILCMQFGLDLLKIADPEQEGQLLPKIAALRQRLTDELGYIIPNIRVFDSTELNSKEYIILVRNIKVAQGTVYPDRVMIISDEARKKNFSIPEDAIAGIEPVSESSVYWIKPEQIDKSISLTLIDPADVMVTHIKECVIKYADEIITLESTTKLVEYARVQSPVCVENLIPNIVSLVDLQKIIVNLVKERVSIKDIVYIFEKLSDYARFSKDPDILSEKLRFSLKKHICTKHAGKDKILYAVTLPESLEKELVDSCNTTEYGKEINLDLDRLSNLIEFLKSALAKYKEITAEQPVILCCSEIRQALFKLLNRHFTEITVLSNKEIVADFKVEIV